MHVGIGGSLNIRDYLVEGIYSVLAALACELLFAFCQKSQ